MVGLKTQLKSKIATKNAFSDAIDTDTFAIYSVVVNCKCI